MKSSQNQLLSFPNSTTNPLHIASIIKKYPREIIFENTIVNFAAIFATIGSLVFAAYAPSGVIIVFALSLVIVLFGVAVEAKRCLIYTQGSLPIPIVINIANPSNSLDALNSLFTIIQSETPWVNYQKNIRKYLNIDSRDLIFKYDGDIFDTEKLKDFLKITKHDLERVKQKTPQNSQFLLAYIGPISVAFLIGAMLAREGLKIFQRDPERNSYQCTMDVRDRLLKEKIKGFEKFEIIEEKIGSLSGDIVIAIDAASHKTKINDPTVQNYEDIILLQSKSGNTIAFDEDWLQYCREIFHVLNEKQQHHQTMRLIYSMPTSIAIAVGMAVQHFWSIELTNYDPKTGGYQFLINMNEVIYHF